MNRKTQTMTERLAEFVTELTYEQIPEHVIETQKKSVLYWMRWELPTARCRLEMAARR